MQNFCSCPAGPEIGPSLSSTCGGGMFFVFMSILEAFLRVECDIEDPCGRVKVTIKFARMCFVIFVHILIYLL